MKALFALLPLFLLLGTTAFGAPETILSSNHRECVASPSAPGIYYSLLVSDSGTLLSVTRFKVNAGYRLSWNTRSAERPLVTDAKTGREARGVFQKTELLRQLKEDSYAGSHDYRVDGKNLILVEKKNRALELDISFGLEAEDKRSLSTPVIFAGAEVAAVMVYFCGGE